jgi:hypothetical protein
VIARERGKIFARAAVPPKRACGVNIAPDFLGPCVPSTYARQISRVRRGRPVIVPHNFRIARGGLARVNRVAKKQARKLLHKQGPRMAWGKGLGFYERGIRRQHMRV